MLINKQAVAEYLARDLKSYVWMKALKRKDILDELAQFNVPPEFKRDPWTHQAVCFWIGLMEPRFLFTLDMGAGKSLLMHYLMEHHKREGNLNHGLVCVPRSLNIATWLKETPLNCDLEPWAVDCENIHEKRERLLNPRGDFTIIDYQGLQWALCVKVKGKRGKGALVRDEKAVRQAQKLYNFIAFDESHKLRNHESLWWGIANQLSRTADFVYALTGTLFGKDIEAAWSQFYLVDRGETFGENLGLFRAAFFDQKPDPWKGVVYTPKPSAFPDFQRMLENKSLRYSEEEIADLPARVERQVAVSFDDEQREHYLRALEGLINADGNLRELDANYIRMRQICAGFLDWKDDFGGHHIEFKNNPKLPELERLLDEAGDSKVVISHEYVASGAIISAHLKKIGVKHVWVYGGSKNKTADLEAFLTDPAVRVFLMNSESGGTGVDGLQQVARYLVFYESPNNPITRQQTIKRVHRPGSKERVFIYDLVIKGSVDAGVLESVREGRDLHDELIDGRVPPHLLRARRRFF